MFLSLLGGGLGGLLRFAPEIIKLFASKGDRDHEFKMTELQLKIDGARSSQRIDEVHAQSEGVEVAGNIQAYLEALKGQSQLTGVKWVDGLNATVRPFLTYWWMLIFTAYKMTVIYDAWTSSETVKAFGLGIWNENDWGVLSMIISFWFVDRVFKYHKK